MKKSTLPENLKNHPTPWLVAASGVLSMMLLFAAMLAPDRWWLSSAIGLLLLATLAAIWRLNRRALKSRSIAYGTHSLLMSLLVVSILGVVNFLGARNPIKFDLTSSKVHTLSEQTRKLVRELKAPIKLVLFAKPAQRQQFKPMLEAYQGLNSSKVGIDYVDPDKEPVRAKQAGIKKYGTLQILAGSRDTQIEEVSEEKLTNALLKVLKEKTPEFCVLTGHGEKSFSSTEADGFDAMRQALTSQAYSVKDLNLVGTGRIPESCSVVLVWGPTKAFFPQEITALADHLKAGGRILIGVDMVFSGTDPGEELKPLLAPWGVSLSRALLIDPSMRAMELGSSVLITNQFAKDHVITRDLNNFIALPFARPIVRTKEVLPETVKVQNLLSTSPKAWAETDIKGLVAGAARFDAGQDSMGVLNPAVAIEGKLAGSTAPKASRLAVFGSASFANNNISRMLNNSDLFLNAAAWLAEDDSTIAIRPRQSEAGRLDISQKEGLGIFLVTVVVMPLLVASAGIGFWAVRRKL